MKNSVVVFFFAGNNHLSNLKTLQSIYAQDYRHIRMIICNDSTYRFENERLLNNFEHKRPENIEHIIFQENNRTVGEFRSQAQFWRQYTEGFFVTLHAGEYFTSASALSQCVRKLKSNASTAAVVCGCEQRDSTLKRVLKRYTAEPILTGISDAVRSGDINAGRQELHDCMVVYRMSALHKVQLALDDKAANISNRIIPWLLENGDLVSSADTTLCMYSEESVNPMIPSAPEELGRGNLERIAELLRDAENTPQDDSLEYKIPAAPKKQKRKNWFPLLKKLSTVSRIMMYAFLALLLCIAGALFLNLEEGLFTLSGAAFLILAFLCAVWTVGMLACNLYLKKNPHRLVG